MPLGPFRPCLGVGHQLLQAFALPRKDLTLVFQFVVQRLDTGRALELRRPDFPFSVLGRRSQEACLLLLEIFEEQLPVVVVIDRALLLGRLRGSGGGSGSRSKGGVPLAFESSTMVL